ncbi:unnamed protein product [Urochloa decumbens]|uniref:F-box domain-containing protein n=1 Tax=Urochloa decumbens TaxID=240449 RepID=A0ABC8W9H5_9POAL
MELRPRQRRRITAAKEEKPRRTSIHDIPDDLLRQILLRLDSPLWLVRAACASKPLHRAVITGGHAFLRIAASLHPPAVVGHYHDRNVRRITFVPSSSPAPPIDGGRFTLDFLPSHVTVTVADCHGGLILLHNDFGSLPSLIVCDPLTRRVLYQFYKALHLHVCVFSTADGDGRRFLRQSVYMGHVAGRVDGSLYLGFSTGNVKVLDNASLELSEVDLPIHIDTSKRPYKSAFTVGHGAGGRNPISPATTRIVHLHGEDLEVFRRVRGGGDGEWVLEHSIAKLSEASRGLVAGCCPEMKVEWTVVIVVAVGTGIAVLSAWDRTERKWLFSVDMGTKELKAVPNKEDYRGTTQCLLAAMASVLARLH